MAALSRNELPEYLDTFPAVAVNTGMLVGHNTLRLMVMGLEDCAPTKNELSQMTALLEDGLRAGALGKSSGLFTPPGGAMCGAQALQGSLFHPYTG